MSKKKGISLLLIAVLLLSVTVGIKFFYMPQWHIDAYQFFNRQCVITERLMAIASKYGDFMWTIGFDSKYTMGEAIGPGIGAAWVVCLILKTITGFAGLLTWSFLVPAACICGICGAMQDSTRAKKYAIRMTVLAVLIFVMVPLMSTMFQQIGAMEFTTPYRAAVHYVTGSNQLTASQITTNAKYDEVYVNLSYYMGYLLLTRLVLTVAILIIASKLLTKLLTILILHPAKEGSLDANGANPEVGDKAAEGEGAAEPADQSASIPESAASSEVSTTETVADSTAETAADSAAEPAAEAKPQQSVGKKVLRKLWTFAKEIIGLIIILYICKYLLIQIADFYGIGNEVFDNLFEGINNIKPALYEVFHGLLK